MRLKEDTTSWRANSLLKRDFKHDHSNSQPIRRSRKVTSEVEHETGEDQAQAPNKCKRCIAFGQPEDFDSPVTCAFENGIFDSDNWQCQTALELRDIMDWTDRDDNRSASIGVIRIPDSDLKLQSGYLVATWYKNRGTTGQMWVMWDDETPQPLRLDTAEFVLDSHTPPVDH